MSNFVIVRSEVDAQVGINIPDLRLKREWLRRGAIQKIEDDVVEQAYYNDPGFAYLIDKAILFIDDMPLKIKLGLEAEETKVPTNILSLDDALIKRLLTAMPFFDFKAKLEVLTSEQRKELAQAAIKMKITDYEKISLLKGLTEINIDAQIKTARDAELEAKTTAPAKTIR